LSKPQAAIHSFNIGTAIENIRRGIAMREFLPYTPAMLRKPRAAESRLGARRKSVRYSQGGIFAGFQSDFLSQHHVARCEASVRDKTQPKYWRSIVVQNLHVSRHAVKDPILPAAATTDHIKVAEGVELISLLGRQPLAQQPLCTSRWGLLGAGSLVQGMYGAEADGA
jgi:hypothetical protein